jgi:MYXO-CTERM domain-containing protein
MNARTFLFALASLSFVVGGSARAELASPTWEHLGPLPLTSGPYTGRVTSIAPHPSDGDVVYVGTATGGVWKLDGTSWQALTEHLPSLAIGAVAVAPSETETIYAGSGEANYALHSFYGLGFYRSTDGGKNWDVLAVDTFAGRTFSRIVVHPQDANKIWASVMHAGGFPARSAAKEHPLANDTVGVFRSTDGGETWEALGGGLPQDVAASDLAMAQDDPDRLFAALGDPFGHPDNGIYISEDGGDTWKAAGSGLPDNMGRISLAVGKSDPKRVYAMAAAESSASGSGASTMGVYRSSDSGQSWTAEDPGGLQATYGWYLSTAGVDPSDADTAFFGGVSMVRTSNGGSSFVDVTPPHVDCHALAWDAKGRVLAGDDGGIHRSDDGGNSWDPLHSELSVVQIYAGTALSNSDPDFMAAGMQDNGSNLRGSGLGWGSIGGGDGGPTANHPDRPDTFLYQSQNLAISRTTNGGSGGSGISGIGGSDRNAFFSPIAFAPSDPDVVYLGTQKLYVSTNAGASFQAISDDLSKGSGALRALAVAPSDADTVYIVTNDGNVAATHDRGKTFEKSLSDHPGQLRTTKEIAVDPEDANLALLAVPAFGGPKVRITNDGGKTWDDASGNLPDIPANAIDVMAADTESKRVWALGTDRGIFVSCDLGANWQAFQGNLPDTHVTQVVLDLANDRIFVTTMGRGAWSVPMPDWSAEDGPCFVPEDDSSGDSSDDSSDVDSSDHDTSSDATDDDDDDNDDNDTESNESSGSHDSEGSTDDSGEATGSEGSEEDDSDADGGDDDDDNQETGASAGCSCQSSSPWGSGALAMTFVLFGWRRRRSSRF